MQSRHTVTQGAKSNVKSEPKKQTYKDLLDKQRELNNEEELSFYRKPSHMYISEDEIEEIVIPVIPVNSVNTMNTMNTSKCKDEHKSKPKVNLKYSKTLKTLMTMKTMKSFENLYNELNFVHGTCTVAWNLDDQKKRAIRMPNLQQRKTTQPWDPNDNMVYVMAEESGLTVVDIDDIQKCIKLTSLCIQYCEYTVKTKKGFYFYFRRCKELGIKLESQEFGFDLPALLYAPPGFYETDKETIEYKFTKTTDCGYENGVFCVYDSPDDQNPRVVDMPQEIIDEIKRLLSLKEKNKLVKSIESVKPVNSVKPVESVKEVKPITSDNKFQKYREFLVLIQNRNQAYEDWRNVGFALHQISDSDEMYEIFAEWSQVDYNNYDEDATQNLWTHCNDDRENGITFGTLVHWAKGLNPEGYKQWNNKWGLGKLKYLVNNFDQAEAAKYFHKCNKEKYVYKESDGWYMLQKNGRWRLSKDAVGFINTIDEFLKSELHKVRNHYLGKLNIINQNLANDNIKSEEETLLTTKKKYCENQVKTIKNLCVSKIGSVNFRKGLLEDFKGLYLDDKLQFNNIWYYLGFEDGVYNLKTKEFRDYKPEDYITLSVGYNYSDIMNADTTTLLELINQIHPNEESRKCWLSVVATSLEGRTLERFNVFNGRGRNGKGLLDEILLQTLGKQENGGYAVTLSPAILCAPIVTDAPKPEIAKLNKMRLVISSEFPAGSMYNNSVIKQLTGGSYMEGRFCHSNKTAVNLQCTLIAECNERPPFREKVTDAEIERLIDLEFPCKFTTFENEVNEDQYIYLANKKYKTTEFQNKSKYAMMKILLDTYAKTNGSIYMPECIKKRSLYYAIFSHWALQWFDENYGLVETPNPEDLVTIQTIFEQLIKSETYTNLTRTERRAFTKRGLIDLFSKCPLYTKYYRERYQPRTNGKRLNARNVLLGFVRRDDDGELEQTYNKDALDPTVNIDDDDEE